MSMRIFGSIYPVARFGQRCRLNMVPLCHSRYGARLFSARSVEYEEEIQQRDIKSEEFYDTQGSLPVRRYFYYVDLQGRLFIENITPKNIATSLKSMKFLNFFFKKIQPNGEHILRKLRAEDKQDSACHILESYPYVSPCGRSEINFIKAADTPFVFHDLEHGGGSEAMEKLVYGGDLKINFDPAQLAVSRVHHRLYHYLETKHWKGFALIRSHIATGLSDQISVEETQSGADSHECIYRLCWHDKQYTMKVLEDQELSTD